jgi:hypothetical protein
MGDLREVDTKDSLTDVRRELARAYNSFFACAPTLWRMKELEKRLMELLRDDLRGWGSK